MVMLPGKRESDGRYCAQSDLRLTANCADPGASVFRVIHPFAMAEAWLLTAESKSGPIWKTTSPFTVKAGVRATSALLVRKDMPPSFRMNATTLAARFALPLTSLTLKKSTRRTPAAACCSASAVSIWA